jgi:hypothetical protein
MDLTWAAPLCWRRVTITVCTTVGKVGGRPQNSLARLWISPMAGHGAANRRALAGSSTGPDGIRSSTLDGTPVASAPA